MGFYFRGTTEEIIAGIFSDLQKATEAGPSQRYFNRALAGIVGLRDRQAEYGALDPAILKSALDAIFQRLLEFPKFLELYTPQAVFLAADRPDRWYEICVRRSVTQLILDAWPETPVARFIDPEEVAALDREMRRVGLEQGPIPPDKAPKGLPASHWWWTYPHSGEASPDPAEQLRENRGRAHDLDLQGADLRGISLRDAHLVSCKFNEANLENAVLSGTVLRLCTLDHANCTGSSFEGARFEDSSAEGAEFSRASFRRAHLTETVISRANLRGADCAQAKGDGITFRGADLRGANLAGAHFDEADFRGADLRGADLTQGRFHSADFRGALLDGAKMQGADCAGAWFDEIPAPRASETVWNEDTVEALREFIAELPATIASQAEFAPELLDRLQKAGARLEEAEPPPEWKEWLEPLAKIAEGNPSPDEVLKSLKNALGKLDVDGLLKTANSAKASSPKPPL